MKKWFLLSLTLLMVCSLAACAAEKQTGNTPTPPEVTVPGNLETTEVPAPTPDPTQEPEGEDGGKILVAYFSATNNTEGVAQHIADILGADTYEILPELPYTTADLDWHDSSSRTTIEMNDPDSRPAISGNVENMEDYDTVFLGYPIWWGDAPHIIRTFLESYDFSGKTMIPFCTSGSSGIGSSATDLHTLTTDTTWLDGYRFSGGASETDVQNWLDSLDLVK